MTKVFISYSHDSEPHKQFVLELANRLRNEGLDCCIDRYINGFPPEGWQHWMEKQIEEADFVLIICTAKYLKRYRGEERNGGKGVTFEGVVIANTLYQNYYQNTKFIPVLPEHGSIEHVPLPLTAYSTYKLPTDYNSLYRLLTGQVEYSKPPLGSIRQLLPTKPNINSGELPTVEGELFGRSSELAMLDKALADTNTHIVQLIAAGGTGKTKLLQYWLDENRHKIKAQLIHSFYSQGSSEDKQISSTPFFIQALKALGSDKTIADFQTEEEKGEHIAELLRAKCCLLVLDGLEPLQQASPGMRGELKDRAIRRLLRQLASDHNSLCIITTRRKVHELEGRKTVHSHDLGNLAPEDGIKLLQSFGVQGRDADMLAAVQEYDCHALALHLLGNAVATYLGNDIRKRDTLPELIGQYDYVEKHAFRVMQAYQYWLAGSVELKLLYLLSLFDHPVEQEVLQVLWEAHIPELTQGVTVRDWQAAQKVLIKEYRMMSAHQNQNDLFDCHPLIREYFARQLKEKYEEAWIKAHTTLYEYYKALPEKLYGKYLPETLEEMQPLFRAVAHGCAANLQETCWNEVYWPLIEQNSIDKSEDNYDSYNPKCYIVTRLGAISDALTVIANFFENPWITPASQISDLNIGRIFNRAGWYLSSLGRLEESIAPMEHSLKIAVDDNSWGSSVIAAYTLNDIKVRTGKIKAALHNINSLILHAEYNPVDVWQPRVAAYSFSASIFHQAGMKNDAKNLYKKAEDIQSHAQGVKSLYSIQGFLFCDLLIENGQLLEARKRAMQALKYGEKFYSLISFALDKLTLGRSWLLENNLKQSESWFNKAITNLRQANDLTYLSFGLITQSVYFRQSKKYVLAYNNLQEAYEIVQSSHMLLHLTDYHLEMARLILAVEADTHQYHEATPTREQRILPFDNGECGGVLTLEQHLEKAAELIKETGYHRRDNELAELQQKAKSSL